MLPAMNPEHPMVTFAQENASKLMCLLIWKARREFPDLSAVITAKDIEEFNRMYTQNGQEPVLAIEGKKDAVVLAIIDHATGRMAVSRAGDPNSPNAVMMNKGKEARKGAAKLRERLLATAETLGSPRKQGLLREAAEALRLLTWEPEE